MSSPEKTSDISPEDVPSSSSLTERHQDRGAECETHLHESLELWYENERELIERMHQIDTEHRKLNKEYFERRDQNDMEHLKWKREYNKRIHQNNIEYENLDRGFLESLKLNVMEPAKVVREYKERRNQNNMERKKLESEFFELSRQKGTEFEKIMRKLRMGQEKQLGKNAKHTSMNSLEKTSDISHEEVPSSSSLKESHKNIDNAECEANCEPLDLEIDEINKKFEKLLHHQNMESDKRLRKLMEQRAIFRREFDSLTQETGHILSQKKEKLNNPLDKTGKPEQKNKQTEIDKLRDQFDKQKLVAAKKLRFSLDSDREDWKQKDVNRQVFLEFERVLNPVTEVSFELEIISCIAHPTNYDALSKSINRLTIEMDNFKTVSTEFSKYLMEASGVQPELFATCSEYIRLLKKQFNNRSMYSMRIQLPSAILEHNKENIDFYIDLAKILHAQFVKVLNDNTVLKLIHKVE